MNFKIIISLLIVLSSLQLIGQDDALSCADFLITEPDLNQGEYTLPQRNPISLDGCDGVLSTEYYLVFKLPSGNFFRELWTGNLDVTIYYVPCCDNINLQCSNTASRISTQGGEVQINLLERPLCSNGNSGFIVVSSIFNRPETFSLFHRNNGGFVSCEEQSCASSGLDCSDARTLTCGIEDWGTFNEPRNVNSYCNGQFSTLDLGEQLYEFTPPSSGEYTFSLSNTTSDLDMFLLNSCDPDDCIASSDAASPSAPDVITRSLIGGQTYWLVVDTDGPSESNYRLTVDCGNELDCSDARTLTCGIEDWGTFNEPRNVNSYCNGQFSTLDLGEQLYEFTPPSSGEYTFSLSNTTSDLDMFLLNSCDPDDCIASSDAASPSAPDVITRSLIGGRTYWLVVDTDGPSESNYRLTVDCGNELDCSDTRILTCGIENWGTFNEPRNVSSYCNGQFTSLDLGEQLYEFTPPSSGEFTFSLSNTSSDLDMFLLNSCDPNDCIASSDATSPNAPDVITRSLTGGRTYWLVVDTDGPSESNYRLEVSGESCCIDLSDRLTSFLVHPDPDNSGAYIVDFGAIDKDDIFPEGRNTNGLWTVDGEEITTSQERGTFTPTPGSIVTICYEWQVFGDEVAGQCYRVCKRYRIPGNPYECDDIWLLLQENDGPSPYVFKTQRDVDAWILHDSFGFIEHNGSQTDDNNFDPRHYYSNSQPMEAGSEIYLSTISFDEESDVYDICCRSFCFDDYFACGQELITTSFTGSETEVNEGDYRFRFSSTDVLPASANVISWKVYPSNQSNDFQESSSDSPEFILPLMPETENPTYTACCIYELDGCIRICCIDICLENPYECQDVGGCNSTIPIDENEFFNDNFYAGQLVTDILSEWEIVDPSVNESAEFVGNNVEIAIDHRNTGRPSYVRKLLNQATANRLKLEINFTMAQSGAKMGVNGDLNLQFFRNGADLECEIFGVVGSVPFNQVSKLELVYTEAQVTITVNEVNIGISNHNGLPSSVDFCGNSGTYILDAYSLSVCTNDGGEGDCDNGMVEISSGLDVAYWTTSDGTRLLNFDGQNTITVPGSTGPGRRYVYCYYYDCIEPNDDGELLLSSNQCCLRVCCIPLPNCTEN